jgi:hypothetical protein
MDDDCGRNDDDVGRRRMRVLELPWQIITRLALRGIRGLTAP